MYTSIVLVHSYLLKKSYLLTKSFCRSKSGLTMLVEESSMIIRSNLAPPSVHTENEYAQSTGSDTQLIIH